MARARSMPARRVERARVVLLAADGLENKQIAQRMNMTPEKAARSRNRFLAGCIAALERRNSGYGWLRETGQVGGERRKSSAGGRRDHLRNS